MTTSLKQRNVVMSLSIAQIIRASLESIRSHVLFYLGLAVLFFCLSLLFELFFLNQDDGHFLLSIIMLLISVAVFAKQAVVVHRSVILGEAGQWRPVFRWGAEDSVFFMAGLGLVLALVLAGFLMAMLESLLFSYLSSTSAIELFGWISSAVMLIAGGMAFSLICLFFPAAAAGHNVSLADSVGITKQQFFKVFLLVALLPFVCSVLINIVLTMAEDLMMQILINLLGHFLVVFYVSVLSHTYLQLTRDQSETLDSGLVG
jgi:hypothetical protein